MNDESRRANRRHAGHDVHIHDTVTEEVIGRLINLSETGMSMIAHRPISGDALYQLRFDLPDQRGLLQSVDAGAHELWTSEATAPGQTWVGFRFIDVSPAHVVVIREWVNAPDAEHV